MTPLPQIQNTMTDVLHIAPSLLKVVIGAEVGPLRESVSQVEQARQQLTAIECAMKLVLQLLEAADNKPLMSDDLHCLLAPLGENLSKVIAGLDTVLG